MDSLPVEVLEKILSFVTDKDTLHSCRLVSRSWNYETTRTQFLRRCVSTAKDMDQFLKLYKKSEEFRYRNVHFRKLNNRVTEAILRLLRICARSIKDVRLQLVCSLSSDNFRKILDTLDSRVLPNLRTLRIEGALKCFSIPPLQPQPQLCFRNLTTLRLTFYYYEKGFGNFAAALVEAAPNLKLFETVLILRDPLKQRGEPFWPFSEHFRAIPTFLLTLRVWSFKNSTESVSEIFGKLEGWRNLRLTEVVFERGVGFRDRAVMPEVKRLMQTIFALAAADLKSLTLFSYKIDLGIYLPPLVALETLEIFDNDSGLLLLPIPADRLRALHDITLRCSEWKTRRLSSTVLESVKVFRFIEDCKWRERELGTFTPWANVFPNLEKFVLVNGAHFWHIPKDLHDNYKGTPFFNSTCWLHLSWIEFLVSHLRMSSLKSVAYGLNTVVLQAKNRAEPILTEPNRAIGNVFSGFDDLEKVVSGAKEAQDEGEYWAEMEGLRRPCIVNLEGLQRFYFDYPIDDDFATGILLRMKPLVLKIFLSKRKFIKALERRVGQTPCTS